MARALFHELYAVGDSLSDSGGIYQLSSEALALVDAAGIDTDGLQPIPVPPYAGKFSNGPVLPEITAELLGAELHNFSFGAAQALGELPFGLIASSVVPPDVLAAIAALPDDQRAPIEAVFDHNINLSGQVADLIAATTAEPPSPHSALVSMIGLNDLRSLVGTFDPSNPAPLSVVIDGIVHANLDLAHTAHDLGIDTVIFETLPATSFFPIASELSAGLQAVGDAAVAAVNQGLKDGASALDQQGFDVRIVDLARMADEIRTDPGTFGFLSLDQPTLLGDGHGVQFTPNPNAFAVEQTGFFDPVHMTTNLHGVFASFAAASLSSHTDFRDGSDDVIIGASGDDFVLAGAGNDRAQLGAGNDIMFGGLGNDIADGAAGSDLIAGGAGDDRISGGAGTDVLAGNAGNDWIDGGAGNDALVDGLGSDTLFGGAGNDWFFTTQAQRLGGNGSDVDHFDGGVGNDTLVVLLDPAQLATEEANVATNFVSGQAFTFNTMGLTITGIEHILMTTQFGFTDVSLPGGDLGERLHQADLFGII